jgi:hypothetical protein
MSVFGLVNTWLVTSTDLENSRYLLMDTHVVINGERLTILDTDRHRKRMTRLTKTTITEQQ